MVEKKLVAISMYVWYMIITRAFDAGFDLRDRCAEHFIIVHGFYGRTAKNAVYLPIIHDRDV